MKKISKLTIALMALLWAGACTDDDSDLKEVGPLTPDYQLPQGKSPADDQIVKFHEDYGTYVLYDYNWLDFYYDLSRKSKYSAPDPEYAGHALDLLHDIWFDLYDSKFNKEAIPYKIFLTDTLLNERKRPTPIFLGDNSLAFGGCNSKLAEMDAAGKLKLKKTVQTILWKHWKNTGRIEIPNEFFDVSRYMGEVDHDPDSYNSAGNRGFIRDENGSEWYFWLEDEIDKSKDLDTYLAAMVSRTSEEWAEDFTFRNVKKKYDILRNFFLEKYGIDVQKIGDKTYQD